MSKTITIRNEVYESLIKLKNKDESFSELFERLAKALTPINTLRKMRGSMGFKEKKKLLEEIRSKRSEARK